MNKKREIPVFSKSSKKYYGLNRIVVVVFIVAVIVVSAFIYNRIESGPNFKIPNFDPQVKSGEPNPPIDLGYVTVPIEEGFEIKLCGRLFIQDNVIDIYATNLENNDVWIKIELENEEGQLIAESGIIKPGEYLKSLELIKNVSEAESQVKIIVIGYEPETYESRGVVEMKTLLYQE
jgi:hypothetical protein